MPFGLPPAFDPRSMPFVVPFVQCALYAGVGQRQWWQKGRVARCPLLLMLAGRRTMTLGGGLGVLQITTELGLIDSVLRVISNDLHWV